MGMIVTHQDELLKINTQKNCIEYSRNEGKSWHHQGDINKDFGEFMDLMDNGKELLGTTTKGLYYSKNKGKSWHKK